MQRIDKIRELNSRVGWMISDYICQTPCAITSDLMQQMLSCREDVTREEEQSAFTGLLSAFCALDDCSSEDDRIILEKYLAAGIKRLEPSEFISNPYYRNINIEERSFGEWEFKWQEYAPFEAFVRDDLILDGDMEIPSVGYFRERFRYPSVMQGGREWMSIKPSEIVTSQYAVDRSHGRTVTFGLGLGYFVYMSLLKKEVKSVTVVERDPSVIELFERYILPQFPRREDVRIVNSDAFAFMEKMRPADYDFAFVDIWHDISDGTDCYVKAKQYEKRLPGTEFTYWLERSLRCALASLLLREG